MSFQLGSTQKAPQHLRPFSLLPPVHARLGPSDARLRRSPRGAKLGHSPSLLGPKTTFFEENPYQFLKTSGFEDLLVFITYKRRSLKNTLGTKSKKAVVPTCCQDEFAEAKEAKEAKEVPRQRRKSVYSEVGEAVERLKRTKLGGFSPLRLEILIHTTSGICIYNILQSTIYINLPHNLQVEFRHFKSGNIQWLTAIFWRLHFRRPSSREARPSRKRGLAIWLRQSVPHVSMAGLL